jgi:hypothetical protein
MAFRTVFGAFFGLLLFSSCRSHLDSSQLAAIDEGFYRADHFIQSANNVLYIEFEKLRYDPSRRQIALVWLPIIARIHSLDSMVDRYTDSVKGKIKKGEQSGKNDQQQVVHELAKYRKQLEESLDAALPDVSEFDRKDIDQAKLHLVMQRESGLEGASFSLSPEILTKWKIDFRLSENYILSFCNKISAIIIDRFDRFDILTGIANGHLRVGDPIEVFAGIGAFSVLCEPTVRIDGREIKVSNETGIALDTLIANTRPGKYKIPIEITFTMPDGSRQTITKNLKYTVDAVPCLEQGK